MSGPPGGKGGKNLALMKQRLIGGQQTDAKQPALNGQPMMELLVAPLLQDSMMGPSASPSFAAAAGDRTLPQQNNNYNALNCNRQFSGNGQSLHNSFRDWWSRCGQSEEPPLPHEFLENFGLPQQTVEKMLKLAISEQPANVGALHYFAEHFQDRLDSEDIHEVCFPKLLDILQWGPGYPTEQDIMSLMEFVLPQSMSDWEQVLTICMRGTYSADFLQFVCGKIPKEVGEFRSWILQLDLNDDSPWPRLALNQDCVLGLRMTMPKIKRLSLICRNWQKEAFVEFLGLLQTASLPELKLDVPETLLEPGAPYPDWKTTTIVNPERNACGLKSFHIILNENHHANILALEAISCLPSLKSLNVELKQIMPWETAQPFVVQALNNERALEGLCIDTRTLEVVPINHTKDTPSETDMCDLLEALKSNASLKKLEFLASHEKWVLSSQKKLLQVLQEHNMTLVTATIQGRHVPASTPVEENIEYYTSLNAYGRAVARDPKTKLADLVALLGLPSSRSNFIGSIGLRSTSILYDLLQEHPGTWSRAVLSGSKLQTGTRKRKRAPEEEIIPERVDCCDWQSDKDTPYRREMIQEIVKLLKKDKKGSPESSLNKLPQIAKQVEVSLYRNAPSFEDYMDNSTLKPRLQQVAVVVSRGTPRRRIQVQQQLQYGRPQQRFPPLNGGFWPPSQQHPANGGF